MRNLLRKIFLWLGAVFWSRRFRITSVIASSFALQAFACTYGTDEPCEKDCYDPSLDCKPVFDYDHFSGKDYSECEQSLADSVKYLKECEGFVPCKNQKVEPEDWMISGKQPRYVCLDEKPADCSFETTNAKQQFVDSLAWECPMNHLKADSSLVGYQCHDNVGYISVEEGEKRRQEYKDWLDRRQGT